jgi:hypothetical protein
MSFAFQPLPVVAPLATEEYAYTPSANIEGYMNVMTTSGWAPKPVKVWTGTEWAIKKTKFWNGTIWIPTYNGGVYGGSSGASPPGTPLFWVSGDYGITKGTGDNITQWLDRSGNGRHLSRSDGSNCPTAAAADTKNGKQVVNFAVANQQYFNLAANVDSALVTNFTIGGVAYVNAGQWCNGISCDDHWLMTKAGSTDEWFGVSNDGGYGYDPGAVTGWALIATKVTSTGSTGTFYYNGSSVTPFNDPYGAPTQKGYDIFGWDHFSAYNNCKWAEYILWDDTDNSLADISTYLNNRWAVY